MVFSWLRGLGRSSPPDDAPVIAPGEPVSWSYEVTNLGNTGLIGLSVTDDQGGSVGCPSYILPAGASVTCTAEGVAEDLTATGAATVPGICDGDENTLYRN